MDKSLKFLISVLFCLQVVLSLFEPLAPLKVLNAEGAESDENVNLTSEQVEVSEQTSSANGVSIFPDCTLAWMSVYDFILDQTRSAYNDPEMYVGNQASIMPQWSDILCWNGIEGAEQVYYELTEEFYALRFEIEDYFYDEVEEAIWYKVKPLDGEILPQILVDNPYILQFYGADLNEVGIDETPPTLLIEPITAVFIGDTNGNVALSKQAVMAAKTEVFSVSELPSIIEVKPVFINSTCQAEFCDLGESFGEYRYVSASSIQLIPMETAKAYENITEAEDLYEYYEVISETSNEILSKLSQVHRNALDQTVDALIEQENKVVETEVMLGETILPVQVRGNLPENHTLQVSFVDDATTMAAGFNISSAEDIIVSLDVNLVSEVDGTIWQPKPGRVVNLSIGIGALGYEDNVIVKMHRKHEDVIQNFDVFVVENGAVTMRTDGFSIYAVSRFEDETIEEATEIKNGEKIELQVTEHKFYMFSTKITTTNWWGQTNTSEWNDIGTWHVDDPNGAIHYTVYSNGDVGNGGMTVRWISIDALKETKDEDVKIYFYYRNGNNLEFETYTLKIVAPKASEEEEVRLYLKDDVNKTGRLIATLVDKNGNELENGLEGAAFSWSRDDGYFITTKAYGDEYRSVNIAVDHGGLVESRKNEEEGRFVPTTYTVEATLADGRKRSAEYTVYYQSEIINADFEFPNAKDNDYTYFPNSWSELYWKTTAPGHTATDGAANVSKDIEYGDVSSGQTGNTNFGVKKAASGDQFAELNAEAFGALYQDIITVPEEDIRWNFSHAPRPDQNWGGNKGKNISNAMYIVIGATEDAQKLQQQDLLNIGDQADEAGKNDLTFQIGETPIVLNYTSISGNTAEYYVWFHDSGTFDNGATVGWTNLKGKYRVPLDQYRTRLFFVSKESTNKESLNAGNLIDATTAGQYKEYLIEYYVGKVDAENQLVIEKYEGEQTGLALMYSFVELTELENLLGQNQYLHKIMINGENYPYSIRHKDKQGKDVASLYIDKYPKPEGFKEDSNLTNNDYSKYDIVMQVYLREVVISVEKNIVFPENMTEEQKLTLIEGYKEGEEYKANLTVSSVPKEGDDYSYSESGSATITKRDPAGKYVGYYAVEDHPKIGYKYTITEDSCTELPGLILESTTYSTKLYQEGKYIADAAETFELKAATETEKSVNFAEVVVTNTYKEVSTTIYYQAVGNGKIKFKGSTDYVDTPSESIAFYTEEAAGADVSPGKGATFVGWFTDPECTKPVEAKHGVVNGTSFKPNANIINKESITFYAKFETASLTIERTGALPGQSFVYHITGKADTNESLDMYVTLACDNNGNGTVTVGEVLLGTYTVKECDDWTWRYPSNTKTATLTDQYNKATLVFNSSKDDSQWLNGYSFCIKNIFDKIE